jgi:hypothetical protein
MTFVLLILTGLVLLVSVDSTEMEKSEPPSPSPFRARKKNRRFCRS